MRISRRLRAAVVAAAAALALSGCSFTPYSLPLPGGADLGSDPITVKAEFQDVLDLVPQSGVRVNDIPVGKVTKIDLKGWDAVVTMKINRDAELPANAVATIRQTSLLGEKFVSLAPPESGATGTLKSGDMIPLTRTGRNPEIEEVFGAASLLLNGGGLDRVSTIVKELNGALDGHESQVKELLQSSNTLIGQLDDNKQTVVDTLEQLNDVAVAANKQTKAITGALDTLPGALTVLNQQRDDLVRLLKALDKLGQVGTRVIEQSKADTVANLKALQPVLKNLNAAGDDLVDALRALPSFPFTDQVVGGSYAKASGVCDSKTQTYTGACLGDYKNLDVQLRLSLDELKTLLAGSLGTATTASTQQSPAASDTSGTPSPSGLPDLISGLTQKLGGASTSSTPAPAASPSPTQQKSGGILCTILGSCRVAPESQGGEPTDLSSLMLQAVTAP